MGKYYLDEENQFIIENYNQKKPFSSFLPSISGLYGKPLWAYYVNRGQCMTAFGIHNKDYSIMEFLPANKAYRQTSLQGFRTFLKVKFENNNKIIFYEPFQNIKEEDERIISQKMIITSYDFRLEEVNKGLGIKIEVMYCTLPGEKISSLIRRVKITNLSNPRKEIEIVDGMPVIIPYYLINNDMKNESNLRQAWMGVEHYDDIPFYKIKALPYDVPETLLIEGGNFYINFDFEHNYLNKSKIIIEPEVIFGNVTDLTYPERFVSDGFSIPKEQVSTGITPCAFGYKKISIDHNQFNETYTLVGNGENYVTIKNFIDNTVTKEYIENKIKENKNLIEGLKSPVFTNSNSKEFDLYCGQTFMDNFLRGGYPIELGNGKHIFYIYSRKHGDLEREYNFFQVVGTYFSQGNSNFRDVNQNRRNDVRFFPYVKEANIKTFFNLIQLDGFNPLVLMGSVFELADNKEASLLVSEYFGKDLINEFNRFYSQKFTPGELISWIETKNIKLKKGTKDEFLNKFLGICDQREVTDFKEGYWVDHWTYNTDLIEQYISIYPDRVIELFFEDKTYTYYDNDEIVLSRNEKYVLTDNGVRQFDALEKIKEKTELINNRDKDNHNLRIDFGTGDTYKSNLASKILCLLVNKMASLDPNGVGIEMEANKPGWCDALNGLPAILGSSINITIEVKRLMILFLDLMEQYEEMKKKSILVPIEVYEFFLNVSKNLSRKQDDFKYWDETYTFKELFREKTKMGISGEEKEISMGIFKRFLKLAIDKINRGLNKAFNRAEGVCYTYFINEVIKYKLVKDSNSNIIKNKHGYPYVKALKFTQRPIPYFLEGPVHMLRIEKNKEKAKELYQSIKKTGLYDEELDMYKVNDNIMDETKEIGRQNVFPRGWLENESIFLHMEYKYFLELLRSGLYDEFFHYFKNALIPFLDPRVYGRSILENSSFIASTVHPDKKVHGTGFVSRLTGASAELLSMWSYMTVGEKPFYINQKGELCLEFKPILPGWLFTEEEKTVSIINNMRLEKKTFASNTFAFKFLGKTLVIYHNDGRKDTFENNNDKIKNILIQNKGSKIYIEGNVIPIPYSKYIREGLVEQIDIYL